MLPVSSQLPRYNREMGADFKKWRDCQNAMGLDKSCFGCLSSGHAWRRDFGNCSADCCPCCGVPFADARKGHAAMDCSFFPQSPAQMGALLASLDGAGETEEGAEDEAEDEAEEEAEGTEEVY